MLKYSFTAVLLLAGCIGDAHQNTAMQGKAPSADQIHPLFLGSAMPDAAMQSIDGNPTRLKGQVSSKPTVLFFIAAAGARTAIRN